MKIILILIYLSLSLVVNAALATDKLTTLNSIANLLVDNIDHNNKNCKLSVEESKLFINIVQARIDEESSKVKNFSTWSKNCQKGCHCGFYMGLLENKLSDPKINSIYEQLKINSKKVTSLNEQKCLVASMKLCNSQIFKQLKKDYLLLNN